MSHFISHFRLKLKLPSSSAFLAFSAFLFLSWLIPHASNATDFSLLGGMTLASAHAPAGHTSSRIGYGVGATFAFNIDPFMGLEMGLIHAHHLYAVETDHQTLDWNRDFLEIPAWFWFSPIPYISVGLGGYYGIATGLTSDIDDAKHNDAGILAMASIRYPIIPVLSWRVAAFYRFGVVDLSSDANDLSQYSRNFDLYLGLILDFF